MKCVYTHTFLGLAVCAGLGNVSDAEIKIRIPVSPAVQSAEPVMQNDRVQQINQQVDGPQLRVRPFIANPTIEEPKRAADLLIPKQRMANISYYQPTAPSPSPSERTKPSVSPSERSEASEATRYDSCVRMPKVAPIPMDNRVPPAPIPAEAEPKKAELPIIPRRKAESEKPTLNGPSFARTPVLPAVRPISYVVSTPNLPRIPMEPVIHHSSNRGNQEVVAETPKQVVSPQDTPEVKRPTTLSSWLNGLFMKKRR